MTEETLDSTHQMQANLGSSKKKIVFSFDTTGSMNPCSVQVRKNLRNLAESMKADLPDLKIGLIVHGDYCDGDNCIKVLDLTDDLDTIMSFINDAPQTSGGDEPECYELVLKRARAMSWGEEGGSLVIIGDATPHEVNPEQIDWRAEIAALKSQNVQVFPLQCLYNEHKTANNNFWKELAELAGTPLLMLESFGDSSNTLEAMAYASAGAEHYEHYCDKVVEETSKGFRAAASSNLSANREKLAGFAKVDLGSKVAKHFVDHPEKLEDLAKSLKETPEDWDLTSK